MSKSISIPIIVFSILFIAEIFSFLAVRVFFVENKSSLRLFTWLWWGITVFLYTFLFFGRSIENNTFKNYYFNAFMMVLILKLVIALAFLISTLVQFFQSFFTNRGDTFSYSRRLFTGKISLGVASVPFAGLLYGIFKTAYDFKVHKVKINSKKLPESFKGFKIIQISDIHTGSLQGEYQLQKAVDLIKELKADLIVFTGDLVNNQTNEAFPYVSILNQLTAPYGVFSTLGNHDYGDYHQWKSDEDKEQNFQEMIDLHERLGWKLLLNEQHVIQKGEEFFTLIGIENWGANLNFKKYGDLNKAYENVDENSFQVLLSHDPSHWSYEVKEKYKNIDLTLSGHTHGFQFGIEIPGFKWSPSKYIYPQWAGLYKQDEQHLYVNRGLGCLGYMGRIGIKPEITLLEFV